MYLKDLIGTDCYIMCDKISDTNRVTKLLKEIGAIDNSLSSYPEFTNVLTDGERFTVCEMPIFPYPKIPFSDLSDFKETTHPQEKVYGC